MTETKQEKLDGIARQIESCLECKVNKTGLAVPGEGSPDAQVVFIGEAPGKEEAKTGRPFVGRSGKVLRSLIAALGYKEQDVFITSPVKRLPVHVSPPGNTISAPRQGLDVTSTRSDDKTVARPRLGGSDKVIDTSDPVPSGSDSFDQLRRYSSESKRKASATSESLVSGTNESGTRAGDGIVGRAPTEEEIDHGRTHLDAQLSVINPKVVVMLGRVAGVALLKKNFSIGRDHGTFIEENGRTYFLTYHPAAPLYSPSVKVELVKDFNKLKKFLSAV